MSPLLAKAKNSKIITFKRGTQNIIMTVEFWCFFYAENTKMLYCFILTRVCVWIWNKMYLRVYSIRRSLWTPWLRRRRRRWWRRKSAPGASGPKSAKRLRRPHVPREYAMLPPFRQQVSPAPTELYDVAIVEYWIIIHLRFIIILKYKKLSSLQSSRHCRRFVVFIF